MLELNSWQETRQLVIEELGQEGFDKLTAEAGEGLGEGLWLAAFLGMDGSGINDLPFSEN